MPARPAPLTPPGARSSGPRGTGAGLPWLTPALAGASLLLSFLPGLAESLQYDRGAVAGGQPWRLITGQLVHWTARMTLVDLGMLAALGLWVERRSRPLLAGTLGVAGLLVAVGLLLFAREVVVYRGSSGLATALFAVVALVLLCDTSRRPAWRAVGGIALLLLSAKTVWEIGGGPPLAAGRLPEPVSLTPVAHLMGVVAGLAAFAVWSLARRRAAGTS